MELTERIQIDDMAGTRITGDGYLVAYPRVARTGIQIYKGSELGKPNMDEVRVYRPPEEVFSQDSLHSYAHRPLTNDHPPVPVNAENWKKYAVGQTGDEIDARDEKFIRVPMVLMDSATIKAFREGKRELSLGYTTDVEWTPGETPDGEKYDAVQRNIRANHLAVVATARGGPELRIGDDNPRGEEKMPEHKTQSIVVDGITVEVSDIAASVINRSLASMQNQIDKLKAQLEADAEKAKTSKDSVDTELSDARKQIETKDAEIETLKKSLADAELTPQQLDSLVEDRFAVLDKARRVVGDKFDPKGKTTADVRREVVLAKVGDAAKDWNDDQITASFNTIQVDAKSGQRNDPIAGAIRDGIHSAGDARDAAYDEYNKNLTQGWRGASAA